VSEAAAAPATTLAEASARRDNNFNLIRLVAAWAVIFGHSHALAVWHGPDPVWSLLQIKFSGTVAVDVFFLVSGFLITASLERNRLRTFLLSRALRIFPALLVCVAACVFVLGPLLTTVDDYWTRPETWRYFTANVGLSTNTAYFLPGVFAGREFESINASLWSLPVEVRCYLALAVLGALSLHRRWRFNTLFLLGLAAGFVLLWPRTLPETQLRIVWCVAFFFTGACAWLNRDAIPLRWQLLLGLVAVAALLHGTRWFFLGYFFVLAYGTLWVAHVPRLPRIRHHDFSYGLYLYGWPAQQLVQMWMPTLGPLGNTLGATLLAGACAVASWFLVERPALRLKPRLHVRESAAVPASATGDAAATPAGDEA
jgi:peptidoglycan/LPS O-acetylase OafA/YrhL